MIISNFSYKVGTYKFYNKFKVGGWNEDGCLCSAEVFNSRTKEWRMISNMLTCRCSFGVGVMNDLLFAVN